MASHRAQILSWYLRRTLKPYFSSDPDPIEVRRRVERRALALPARGVIRERAAGSVKGEWLRPSRTAPGRTILYLHGGGYIFGTPETHRNLTSRIAKAAAAPLFSLDYRRAPEHPCPAAVEDAEAAYAMLLGAGVPAREIFIGGDSAGGGLTLALTQAIIAKGWPAPGGLFLFSPWTDLSVSGATIEQNDSSDPMFSAAAVRRSAQYYASAVGARDPRASPLWGDFSGFPKMLIFAAETEVLLDDSRRLAERARAAGVSAELKIYSGPMHAWPLFSPLLPEAQRTILETAAFIRGETA
jgi:acetyl esterase/lipase